MYIWVFDITLEDTSTSLVLFRSLSGALDYIVENKWELLVFASPCNLVYYREEDRAHLYKALVRD